MKKITKAQRNADIIAILTGKTPEHGTTIQEAVAHLENENRLLANRKSSKKVSPENTERIEKLYELISASDKPVLLCEVTKGDPDFYDVSSQQVTAFAKRLCDDNRIVKEVIKGRTHFKAV
jgi:hypothetical protein